MSSETGKQRNGDITSTRSKLPIIIITIIAILVVAVLVGVIVYLLQDRADGNTNPGESQQDKPYTGVVTPDNVEDVVTEMQGEQWEHTPIGYYEVNMSTEWSFPDGKSESSDAYVANAKSNQNPVYFTVAPATDSNRIIYTSPLLLVGSELNQIKLDEQLDAGEYDCVLTYHLMDSNDNEVSTVSVSVSITIEN